MSNEKFSVYLTPIGRWWSQVSSQNAFAPAPTTEELREMHKKWCEENPEWLEVWDRFKASGLRVDMYKVKELEEKLKKEIEDA